MSADMTDIVGKITAVVDEAQRTLGTVAPLPVRMHRGHEGWEVRSDDGGLVSDGSAPWPAQLIVSVVNREARQIEHARDVLARHYAGEPTLIVCECDSGNCARGCDEDFDRMIVPCEACSHSTEEYAWYGEFDCCPEIESLAAVWCPEDES